MSFEPKARVLIVITLAETGGAQSYVRDLVPALVERWDVVVAAYGPGPLAAAVTRAGARFVPLRHVRRAISPRDVLGVVELVRLMRRERPALMHANSSKAGVLARLAAPLARVPLRLFTVHGWAFKAASGRASELYRWSDRAVRPLTTAVVCVSERERAAGIAARTCSDAKTVVIHNAVDVAAFRAADPAENGRPLRVVTVGRIAAPKDYATLVRAAGLLEPGSIHLTLVGDGPERAVVEASLAALGLAPHVDFVGDVTDVPERLATAHVFVLASRSEGFPISVLEAMAAGLPVVASDVGGVAEAVEDGVTGLLVPAGDAEALAARLAQLAADPAERQRLGEAGRARAAERFDLPQWRERHVRLYEHLLATGHPPEPAVPAAAEASPDEAELTSGPRLLYPLKAAATRGRSLSWLLRRRPPLPPAGTLRILFYHRISDDADELAVSPRRFRQQMETLAALGARVTDVQSALDGAGTTRQPVVGLSFDDAYLDVAENAVPVLRELGFSATVFVPTGVVDGHAKLAPPHTELPLIGWEQLQALDREGVLKAEAHSVNHRNLLALDEDAARAELAGSRSDLARRLERPVSLFAYPAGLAGAREFRLARETGYAAAVTCEPGLNDARTDRHALRRTQIDARDSLLDFRAKVGGGHDSPLPLRSLYRRLRFGAE